MTPNEISGRVLSKFPNRGDLDWAGGRKQRSGEYVSPVSSSTSI